MDKMEAYSKKNDIPAFIGEYGATTSKDDRSRVKWMLSVILSAEARDMVPVLWDIGQEVKRTPPYNLSPDLSLVLQQVEKFNKENGISTGQ